MHRSLRRQALLALAAGTALAVAACSGGSSHTGASTSADETSGTDAGASATDDAGADGAPSESCYAQLHWLQKDAYKNTGGRTDPAWPPHTTTVLEVHCVDSAGTDTMIGTAFRDNHGSDPGAVDATGRSLLDEVKVSDPAPGTRDQLLSLLSTYTQCECAPTTQFLSMENAQGPLEQQILGTVITYVQANLVCSGAVTTDALVGMLQSGDFDGAVAALPGCAWSNGADWNTGLTQAMQTVLAAENAQLSGYHVCNNDAMLEANLFNDFASTGAVVACDNTTPTCAGPAFFYNP